MGRPVNQQKILLLEVQKAILQLQNGKIQSYQLDTGQTNTKVTRQNISQLSNYEKTLLSDIRDLELKLGKCTKGTVIVQAGW